MDVTEQIEALMRERGWTIYRLGKETGLSQSTLAHVFRRDSAPTIATLETICRAFGISLSQFFAEGPSISLSCEQEQLLSKWTVLTREQRQIIQLVMNEFGNQNRPRG